MELREYQLKLIQDIRNSFKRGRKSVCAVLSCGGGKSVIAGHIAKSATAKGNRVLFLVHRDELCKQITETFIKCGVDMELCTVGMVQTVSKRLAKTKKPSLIIVDEFHHALAKTYTKIFDKFKDVPILGFTATPTRLKEGGLGEITEELIPSVSVKWLVENSFLSPYRYYSVPVAVFDGVKEKNGDYDPRELSQIMEDQKIYGETVKNYKKIADNKKAIIYCSSVESAKRTAEEFRNNGYSAESLDGGSSNKERMETMNRFRNNELKILTNCDLFGEGLDVPDVECVVLLRKTKSLTLYIQQSMRAMRYIPDKTALVIDHVGNIFEHGFPDADREWSLDGKEPKENLNVKTCETCFAVVPARTQVCPYCGTPFYDGSEDAGGKKANRVVDMDLQEINELEFLKAVSYHHYKKLRKWEDMIKFAEAKENIKKKVMWSIYKCVELNIEIPEKYESMKKFAIERLLENERNKY